MTINFNSIKNIIIIATISIILSGCTSLTYQEKRTLRSLKAHGITVEKAAGHWEEPANPMVAGVLNIFPGFGNFYLAAGNGGDGAHYVYGFLNLLTWPLSMFWGIPEAAIDANRINERELIYYYTFEESGKEALKQKKLTMTNTGEVEELEPETTQPSPQK